MDDRKIASVRRSGRGVDLQQESLTTVRNGDYTASFWQGDLRYFDFAAIPIVQRLYGAVRDENWDSVPFVLTEWSLERKTEYDVMRFTKHHKSLHGEIDFRWHGTCEIFANGTVIYTMAGAALHSFRYCKIGINCHLALDTFLGKSYVSVGRNGSENGVVPFEIVPQQNESGRLTAMWPAFSRCEFSVADDLVVDLQFLGTEAEVQDHRNWGDGNLKVFAPPQTDVEKLWIAQGERIWQRAIVKVRSIPAVTSSAGSRFVRQMDREGATVGTIRDEAAKWAVVQEESKVVITVAEEDYRLPKFGATLDDGLLSQVELLTGEATDISAALFSEASRIPEVVVLDALRPDYVLLRLELGSEGSIHRLIAGVVVAEVIGCALDLIVTAASIAELCIDGLTNCLGVKVRSLLGRLLRRVVVLGSPRTLADENWVTRDEAVSLVSQQVAGIFGPSVIVGGGTQRFFTELNRVRPQWTDANSISFTLNPQVHSCDTLSLFDNLCGLADIGVMSHRLFGTSYVAIDGLAPIEACKPFSVDVQEQGEFSRNAVTREFETVIACWVLGAVKQLGKGGIDCVSLFGETTNCRGLVSRLSDMQIGVSEESLEGALASDWLHPLLGVVKWLGSVGTSSIRSTLSSAGTYADALVVERSDGTEMAVYNGTRHFQEVLLGPLPGEWAQIVPLEDVVRNRWIFMWDDKFTGGIRVPLESERLRVVVPPFGVAFAKSFG